MAEFEEVGVEAVVKGFPLFIAQLNAMSLAITGSGVASVGAAAGLLIFTAALAAIVAVVAVVVGGIALIVAGFAAITIGSIAVARSVESAFAGVAKTTNGLTDEFGKMNEAGKEVLDQFRLLSKEVPLSLEDLLKIGELAGQLGIAKDALVGFSEVVAALAVTTDLTVEKATLGLARIANIYEITAGDMVTNTEAVGSALVFLGNNFATTEGEILDFAKRIAGVAKIAGITQSEILGIGAAFTSVGIEAQAGGTAVQTVIIEMTKAVAQGGEELELFAKVSGKAVDEFVDDWKSDAAGAFDDFVQGLGNSGDEAFTILDDLGIADRRIIRAFLAVAGAGDLMTRAIEGSSTALEDNTALARETQIRYATFDSQMVILKNTIRDIGLEIGLLLLPALTDLFKIVSPIVEAIGKGLVPAFESIFDAIIGSLLPAFGDLIDAFGFDVTSADLTQGIANFGKTIAGGIESFADFVEEVANLVELYREGGIDSVAAHFGISREDVDLIEDIGRVVLIAAGSFIALRAAIIGATIIIGIVGSMAAVMGNLGAAIALIKGGAGIFAVIGSLLAGIFTGFAAAPALLVAALAVLIAVIVVWGKDALAAFTQILLGILLLFINWFDDMVTLFRDMWATSLENQKIANKQFVQNVIEWKDETLQKIDELVNAANSAVENWWAETGAKILEGIENAVQSIVDWGNRTIEAIVTFIENAKTKVTEWWDGIIDTFNEKGGEVTGVLNDLLTDWVNALNDSINKWVKVGKAIMDGLLRGLKENTGQILLFITSLAKKVLDAIMKALGVSSPSTEFAEIGKFMMEGLAMGIRENVSLPQIALDAAATRMIGAENGIASTVASGGNIDRSFNPTINANYSQSQAPGSIASDMALIAMLQAAG